MERMTLKQSFQRVATMATFHLGRLETHKKTKELHAAYAPTVSNYVQHWTLWREARARRSVLLGVLDFADADFDDSVADLSGTVWAYADRDRTSVVYRTFFPEGRILETTSAPVELTQRAVDRLVAAYEQFPDAVPKEMVERMQQAGAEVLEAMEKVREQETIIAKYRANMEIARISVAKIYNDNASHVALLFSGKRRLVDSFFWSKPESKDDDQEQS